ncbi:hypothetical protein [Negadavirga shengliensis]|uniref:Uncharacterized protein n=1 Tax=Negadavirga shengliensis TaxID=1389218 RepID=A0ABV9SW65_9BACT
MLGDIDLFEFLWNQLVWHTRLLRKRRNSISNSFPPGRQLGSGHNSLSAVADDTRGNQVAWLNADREGPGMWGSRGPARTQRIYQGEKIRLSVHGKYHNPNKKPVNPGSVAGWGMKSRLEKELLEFSASTTRSASPNAIAVLNIVHLMVTQLRRKDAPEAYMMPVRRGVYALYDADSILYDQGKQVLTKNAANKHEFLESRVRKETVRWTVLGRGRLAGRVRICIFHMTGIGHGAQVCLSGK